MRSRRPHTNQRRMERDGPSVIGSPHPKPIEHLHYTCTDRRACKGSELPPLRRKAGVCKACMAARMASLPTPTYAERHARETVSLRRTPQPQQPLIRGRYSW